VKTDLGPPLGAGKEAEIYAYRPGWVVKLTRWRRDHAPARREDAILRGLAPTGLAPAANGVVQIDERWGVVMERVEGSPLVERLAAPNGAQEVLEVMVALHRRMHAVAASSALAPLKDRLVRNITSAPFLDEPTRQRLLKVVPTLPDGDRLGHGDFHPFNILGTGEAARVVDWLDASAGDPAADVCRTFVLIGSVQPDLAERYVDAYCAASGIDRMAVYAWLPVVAAARLAEKVPEETPRLLALARGEKLR
jgi:aminoglycoside phosphotransferase (APT) family kinase protein